MYIKKEQPIREAIKNTTGPVPGNLTFTSSPEVRVPQLAEELEQLEKSLCRIAELLDALEIKLHPVLVPILKDVTEDCPRPCLVPAADSVYSLKIIADFQADKLQSIINRTEV
jgi:hypothetical protein